MFREGWFHRFCAALDTPGGHMLAGFGLIVSGFIGTSLKVPKAEDMVIAGITVITMGARGQNGKGTGVQPPPEAPKQQ